MEDKLRLIIRNVGILEDVDILFKKNTVLVGKNSTGKSTVLQILYALLDYFEKSVTDVLSEKLLLEQVKKSDEAIITKKKVSKEDRFKESWNSCVGIELTDKSVVTLAYGENIIFTTDNLKFSDMPDNINIMSELSKYFIMVSSTRVLDYASLISHAEYNKKSLKGSNYAKGYDLDLVKLLADIESDVIITDDYNNIRIKDGGQYILASNYSSGHKIFRLLQTLIAVKKNVNSGFMILDEPEQGCTPKMQLELAEIFRFSEESFVFTTHSDFIVNYLLGDEDTRFYITKKSSNGKVIIEQTNNYDDITNMFMWYNKRGEQQ